MLYKYRSLSEIQNQNGESAKFLTWMILRNSSLWFAKPDTLNDPLDCQISIKELSTRILESRPTPPFISYPRYNYQSPFKADYLKTCEDIDTLHSNHGVLSLCTSRENLVMWSHYADEYRGLCFGFDQELLTESVWQSNFKLYGYGLVDYCEETPLIALLQDSLNPNFFRSENQRNIAAQLFASKMTSKQTQWSYEQEYRLLTNKYGSCAFKSQALKEVILGHAILEKDKLDIVEYIKEKLPHVKIYESFFNGTFKLHFKIYVPPNKVRKHEK